MTLAQATAPSALDGRCPTEVEDTIGAIVEPQPRAVTLLYLAPINHHVLVARFFCDLRSPREMEWSGAKSRNYQPMDTEPCIQGGCVSN
jgi:hypothetical protein